jgi:hypothetical protein
LGENFPFGEKITFLWEIFSDLYVVNGKFLVSSLLSYLGNFSIPYVVNGEFIEIFWGLLLNKSGNTGPQAAGRWVGRSVGRTQFIISPIYLLCLEDPFFASDHRKQVLVLRGNARRIVTDLFSLIIHVWTACMNTCVS